MTNRTRNARPEGLCIAHPIHVKRPESTPQVQAGSQATVECEVKHRTMPVTQCQQCERFHRVEVHEGAYVLLCKA
jgi:hypothetical protein